MYLLDRGALSGTATVFWMGDNQTEVKCWVKTWTDLLAEIIFQGSTEEIFWQYNSRERESRDRERERGRGGYKRDFDSSKSPGQDLSAEEMSMVQVDILIQGSNSTLVQPISLIIGKIIEIWP